MPSPVHHTFGPLADGRQRLLAIGLLFQPWKWKCGTDTVTFEHALSSTFGAPTFLFASGRESLLALLRALGIGENDEVIVQGYTCIVVPNAIHAAGAIAVYADIDRETLNLTVADVEAVRTSKTKAVICQHTFGIPADAKALRALCNRHGMTLIEDCAHVLPDTKNPDIGLHGHAAILSFGRDKAISGVAGGAVLCRNNSASARICEQQTAAHSLGLMRIKTYLLYPLLYGIGRPTYSFGGKIFLYLCARLGLLPSIVDDAEKRGRMQGTLHHIPNACAALALDQWQRRDAINDHRRALVAFYLRTGKNRGWFRSGPDGHSPLPSGVREGLALQKFPLFLYNADALRAQLKHRNIHLDDGWTGCVVCPRSVELPATGYVPGSDPAAEALCEKIFSLPTHPGMTMRQAEKLVAALGSSMKIAKAVSP